MQYISAAQVDQACSSYLDLVNALEDFHRDAPADLKDMLLSSVQKDGNPDNHFLVRAAWSHGVMLGLKAACIFPNNTINSICPRFTQSIPCLTDKNGVPSAVIDGTSMTYYKTAAGFSLGWETSG